MLFRPPVRHEVLGLDVGTSIRGSMKRREFIRLVGSSVAAWPLVARAHAATTWPIVAHAQQAERTRRIGVLMGYAEVDREGQAFVAAFREGLQKLGWTEGRNVQIDVRWGAGKAESTLQLARELVAQKPDLILSHSTVTTTALLKQTSTIPVVFANVTDPVGSGFVANFPKPGRNATGFVNMEDSMSGKWLQLLKEVAPRTEKVAFLFNPTTAPYFDYYLSALKAAAQSFGVTVVAAPGTGSCKFELVVNLKAARALELEIPLQLQQRADDVIE